MVVGVEQSFPSQFIAPVGDDFVQVHVALGAAAGLPDGQGEVPCQFAGQDFVAGLADYLAPFGIQVTQSLVSLGG